MELAHQSNPASASTSSLTSFYVNSASGSKFQSQNLVFYDDNSFYKPGSNALSCNRNDKIFDNKKKEVHDPEEGPDWIKELNKLVSTMDGKILKKYKKIKLSQRLTTTFLR